MKRPRRLDDYVSSGDTSHTVIDWVADNASDLLGSRHRLLTGAVYEWPNRQRPAIDQSGSLNKMWWSAVPTDPLLHLANLPVRDGRLLTLAQFRDRLRDLNAAHPELQIQIASTQNDWEKQLGELGIDTALYRYQARMNTSEGGIARSSTSTRSTTSLIWSSTSSPHRASAGLRNRHPAREEPVPSACAPDRETVPHRGGRIAGRTRCRTPARLGRQPEPREGRRWGAPATSRAHSDRTPRGHPRQNAARTSGPNRCAGDGSRRERGHLDGVELKLSCGRQTGATRTLNSG